MFLACEVAVIDSAVKQRVDDIDCAMVEHVQKDLSLNDGDVSFDAKAMVSSLSLNLRGRHLVTPWLPLSQPRSWSTFAGTWSDISED